MSSRGELPELTFRPARPKDRPRVLEITAATWEEGDYIAEVFDAWLAEQGGRFIAVELGGRLVAIAKLTDLGEGEMWLEGLRVDPAERKKGIGLALHNYNLDLARRLGGRVIRYATGEDIIASQRFGERTGFRRVGVYRRHVADPSRDSPPPVSLGAEDWPELVERLASPRLRAVHGLYHRGRRWCTLSEARLRAHLQAGEVFGLRVERDLRAWALCEIQGPEALIHFLDAGEPADVIAMAQALRRLGADAGVRQVKARAPDPSSLAEALPAAGYQPRDYTLWVYEMRLADPES